MTPLIAVVGPTASGKTALAIELAERLGAEIISADCMQIYRGMEIGTAAPTPAERARVPHHFVSCRSPAEFFSAGEFEQLARQVLANLDRRGQPAILAGGAGLYIRALIDGLFPGPSRDDTIRLRLQHEARQEGVLRLYSRLQTCDPLYAASIGPNDLRRIVRALEVFELTGAPLSALHQKHRATHPPLPAVQLAVDWPREDLYARINARVDAMFANGLIEETQRLLDAGHEVDLQRIRGLGYLEVIDYLQGQQSLDEAIDRTKMNTRRYAKRQLTWFRADKRIHWIEAAEPRRLVATALQRLHEGFAASAPPMFA